MNLKYCKHCKEEYTATKSNQKYCSNTCRTKACYKRKNYQYIHGHYESPKQQNQELVQNNNLFINIASATMGNLLSNKLTDLFTEEPNKPVIKQDLYYLIELIEKLNTNYFNQVQTITKNQKILDDKLTQILKQLEKPKDPFL